MQTIRYFRQEPISGCAVQNSVVEGQREIDHRADGNRVVNDDRSFLYRAHAQDGALRLVDDWCGEQRAGNGVIGNRERPAFDFIRLEFPGAGAVTLAVGCPFCMVMLTDAAKADGEQVKVLDVAEILAARLK